MLERVVGEQMKDPQFEHHPLSNGLVLWWYTPLKCSLVVRELLIRNE